MTSAYIELIPLFWAYKVYKVLGARELPCVKEVFQKPVSNFHFPCCCRIMTVAMRLHLRLLSFSRQGLKP